MSLHFPSRVSPAIAHSVAATIASHLDIRRVLVIGPAHDDVVHALRSRLQHAAVVSHTGTLFDPWMSWPELVVSALEVSSSADPHGAVQLLATVGSHTHVAFVERGDVPLIPVLERTFHTLEWFIQEAGSSHANLVFFGSHRELSKRPRSAHRSNADCGVRGRRHLLNRPHNRVPDGTSRALKTCPIASRCPSSGHPQILRWTESRRVAMLAT